MKRYNVQIDNAYSRGSERKIRELLATYLPSSLRLHSFPHPLHPFYPDLLSTSETNPNNKNAPCCNRAPLNMCKCISLTRRAPFPPQGRRGGGGRGGGGFSRRVTASYVSQSGYN